MAIGLAAVVTVVPASFAKSKPAGTGIILEQPRTTGGLTTEAREQPGVLVAVPVGKVWVDAGSVDGGASYVRRTKAKEGMTIVEISATPFMPDLPGSNGRIARPAELPASW